MDPDDVIVEVAKIDPVLGLDRLVRIAGQPVQDLALGPRVLVELMADRLTRKIDCECPWRGVLDHRVLDRIDSLVELLDRGERLIDGQLEEAEEQVIGAIPQPIPGIALDVLRAPDRGSPREHVW